MSRPTPIRTINEIRDFITRRYLDIYQNAGVMYGAMRVFYDKETLDAAAIPIRPLPMIIQLQLPPLPANNATDEERAEHTARVAEIKASEPYQDCAPHTYTVEEFCDWLSIPN